jgi:hypothetical protein
VYLGIEQGKGPTFVRNGRSRSRCGVPVDEKLDAGGALFGTHVGSIELEVVGDVLVDDSDLTARRSRLAGPTVLALFEHLHRAMQPDPQRWCGTKGSAKLGRNAADGEHVIDDHPAARSGERTHGGVYASQHVGQLGLDLLLAFG